MGKRVVWIITIVGVGILTLVIGAKLHGRAMTRAAFFNARRYLQDAYDSYRRTGMLPHHDGIGHVRIMSKTFAIGESNYQTVLALDWPYFLRDTLAVTSNQVFLVVDPKGWAEVIGDDRSEFGQVLVIAVSIIFLLVSLWGTFFAYGLVGANLFVGFRWRPEFQRSLRWLGPLLLLLCIGSVVLLPW